MRNSHSVFFRNKKCCQTDQNENNPLSNKTNKMDKKSKLFLGKTRIYCQNQQPPEQITRIKYQWYDEERPDIFEPYVDLQKTNQRKTKHPIQPFSVYQIKTHTKPTQIPLITRCYRPKAMKNETSFAYYLQ